MQNASLPQKAGGAEARRLSRAALLAMLLPAAPLPWSSVLAEAASEPLPLGVGPGEEGAPDAASDHEARSAPEEGGPFVPAAAPQTPPAPPPAVPVGARSSEAPPGEPGPAAPGEGGLVAGRLGPDDLVAPREQSLATIVFPAFVPVEPGEGGGAPGASLPPPPVPLPPAPTEFHGTSAAGVIATLTMTRRIAPDWLVEAVGDDPLAVQFVSVTSAGLPAAGMTRQVSIAWADLDGDGARDGHLYRIDNANDLAVTVTIRLAGGAALPGSATVAGETSGLIWVPLTGPATLSFHGSDAAGAPISWTRPVNTQNGSDMTVTAVSRFAWAGEIHEATAGPDLFFFSAGEGVDVILGYDPGEDAVLLPSGTAARVVDVHGTAALLVGPTNREGIVFDGVAWTPSLSLADLNVLFV